MGIKHFFTWLRTTFPDAITSFSKNQLPPEIVNEIFMIDLNGLFHTSAQRVYQYGNSEKPKRLLDRKPLPPHILQQKCFNDICASIEELVRVSRPMKKLVMCIDGVPPQGKQNQQRQRRYRGSVEDPENFFNPNSFDTCSITPGTKFMDSLSRYIDWYIRKRINESQKWSNIEIVFSNEKVPGEGEHKLMNFVRSQCKEDEFLCINALDADLVMLALASHHRNFRLLREDLYTVGVDYTYIDIDIIRHHLITSILKWDSPIYVLDEKRLINDFILLCFLCGNDFLPNIPSIAIMSRGLDTIISIYKSSCMHYGHLVDENGTFNKASFQSFLRLIGASEKSLLEEKIRNKIDYIEDPLLTKYTQIDQTLDFESYKLAYYDTKKMLIVPTSMAYLVGCQWVLSYYTKGVSDWAWVYPYNYAPFACDLSQTIDIYYPKEEIINKPIPAFQQLLCVLPPKSAKLLPHPLDDLFKKGSPLLKFCPDVFTINYEGKKKKWEGIVELPAVDITVVEKTYLSALKRVSDQDLKRNSIGQSMRYNFSIDFIGEFQSPFGNIPSCAVNVEPIDF